MAGLGNTGITGFLASAKFTGQYIIKKGKEIPEMIEHFLTGFAGYGWKIWEYTKGKFMLEIDSIRVRGTMTVYELLIHKIRAVIGALAITQGQGKIKTVALSPDQSEYIITVEGDMSFVKGDFIRCQTWTGKSIKMYHVKIDRITDNKNIHVLVEEFDYSFDQFNQLDVENAPEVADEIVQFGNEFDTTRQSAIYIHADESGQPAIDVMFGINSKDWTNCVKIRLGGDIPGADGLKGFFVENGMIKGTDSTGHTTYCIYPDGTAEFGDRSAMFNPDRSGQLAGGAISWYWDDNLGKYKCVMDDDVILTWENLDTEVKDNIKPKIGANGNWWIGGVDTGVKAAGEDAVAPIIINGNWAFWDSELREFVESEFSAIGDDGHSPYVDELTGTWWEWNPDLGEFEDTGIEAEGRDGEVPYIGPNGNWWIGEEDTGVKAEGKDGIQGIQGPKGETGSPTYTWVRYADTSTGTGMHQYPAGKKYIGFAYNKDTPIESSTPSDYKWSLIQGEKGQKGDVGDDGTQYYFWLKYADTPTSGMSDDPEGKKYMGIAVNKLTPTESTDYSDYSWQLTVGRDANLLPWVEEWDSNKTQIGNEHVVSPKMFSGTRDAIGRLTGVALGRDCITIDGVKHTGIFALDEDELMVELDPLNKKYKFKGEIHATSGSFTGEVNATSGKFTGEIIAASGKFTGEVNATSGKIAGFTIAGNGLSNGPLFNNDAYVIFRNDDNKTFAGIGGNVLPATSGAKAVARFENRATNAFYGTTNHAMLVEASGATRNIAISAIGDIVMKGAFINVESTFGSIGYTNDITLRIAEFRKFLFYPSSGRNISIDVPTGAQLSDALGTSSMPTNWSIDIEIAVAYNAAGTIVVVGQAGGIITDNNGNIASHNSDHAQGGVEMTKGDVMVLRFYSYSSRWLIVSRRT